MTTSASFVGRVQRLEGQLVRQERRGSFAGAFGALMAGTGTRADLEILYAAGAPRLRERLVEGGVDRVMVPSVWSFKTWDWIQWILARPPGAEVPANYREQLAAAAALDNPYERLRRGRPKHSIEDRDALVLTWIAEQLFFMAYERNDELEMRTEVAAKVPREPAEVLEFLRIRQEKLDAQGEQSFVVRT